MNKPLNAVLVAVDLRLPHRDIVVFTLDGITAAGGVFVLADLERHSVSAQRTESRSQFFENLSGPSVGRRLKGGNRRGGCGRCSSSRNAGPEEITCGRRNSGYGGFRENRTKTRRGFGRH